jgi:hypothetical protein
MGSIHDNGAARKAPLPFVPSPPIAPEGALPAELSAMAERVMSLRPSSGAETLQVLRREFPNSPLAARISALNVIARRRTF